MKRAQYKFHTSDNESRSRDYSAHAATPPIAFEHFFFAASFRALRLAPCQLMTSARISNGFNGHLHKPPHPPPNTPLATTPSVGSFYDELREIDNFAAVLDPTFRVQPSLVSYCVL